MKDGRWTVQYRIPSPSSTTGWGVTLDRQKAVDAFKNGETVMVRDVKVWDSDWRRLPMVKPRGEWKTYQKETA